MKKILCCAALLGFINYASAQNTFPATGNVGIGTTTPTGKLQVKIGSVTDLLANNNSVDIGLSGTTGGWARAFRVVNTSGSDGLDGGTFGVAGNGTTPNYIYMAIPTTEPLGYVSTKIIALNNLGNVGIGTTSPATALHVKTTSNTAGFSNLTIENTGATGNEAGLNFKAGYTTTSLNSGRIYSLFDGGTGSANARLTLQSLVANGIYDNTLTVRSGKVGIGTVNPVALLQINDINTATSTRGNVFIGTTDAAAINAGGQLGFGGSYTGTTQTSWAAIAGRKENETDGDYSGYLQFITRKNGSATVERARITSDGSLGIGTTAPGLKTHINGVTGFPATTGTAQTGVLRLQGLSNNAVLDFGVNGTSGAYLQATNQTALNATYPLLLNPNGGNVGIGVTNPTDKLAVNGTIHTKEVRVDLTGWPDYVFKKDYKLPTLTEVKDYIDKNQRLPDMPSEKEVADNGLNLGEMNKILTKKVEELTLYLIEQNKRIEKLESVLKKSSAH